MNVDQILSQYNVFVTGASGFIGHVLLQRLLRVDNAKDCKIFCLLRCGKKHSSVTERLRNEILSNEIFELELNEIDALIESKRVVAMEGELVEDFLGLDDKQISQLKTNENQKGIVVIHCAADIDFNREINASIAINVNGTFNAISVAKEIEAVSFIHISTLYVNSREHRNKEVMEQIYDSGIDFVGHFQRWRAANGFDKECLARFTSLCNSSGKNLQRKEWPNSYTLTKHMAEHIVMHYCREYKPWICNSSIIRLGIVSPIHRGQHLGWFMGNGGFVFLVCGIATGNIRYLNGDGQGRPDFVPVDYTADVIMSATASTVASAHRSLPPKIYQCGVIANDPTWSITKCVEYTRPHFMSKQLPYVQPDADITFIESKTLFFLIELILYDIPLFVIGVAAYVASLLSIGYLTRLAYHIGGYHYVSDLQQFKSKQLELTLNQQIRSLNLILNDKPYNFVKRSNFMSKARAKLNWFHSNYTFFVNQRWRFDHSNIKKLHSELDTVSQVKYNCDVNHISFNAYACESALVCFRKYVQYRDTKKKVQIQIEKELRKTLDQLLQQRKLTQQTETETDSLSNHQRLQILQVLRKLFFMFGFDVKITLCILVSMAIISIFSFFQVGIPRKY